MPEHSLGAAPLDRQYVREHRQRLGYGLQAYRFSEFTGAARQLGCAALRPPASALLLLGPRSESVRGCSLRGEAAAHTWPLGRLALGLAVFVSGTILARTLAFAQMLAALTAYLAEVSLIQYWWTIRARFVRFGGQPDCYLSTLVRWEDRPGTATGDFARLAGTPRAGAGARRVARARRRERAPARPRLQAARIRAVRPRRPRRSAADPARAVTAIAGRRRPAAGPPRDGGAP